jgi:hypothetical protein
MSAYSIALFLHIVGALGFFAALGVEWMTLIQLRRATTVEQIRDWLSAAGSFRRVGMISMLTLLIAGLYMMITVWGGIPWLLVSFVAIALMMVTMGRISSPRLKVIRQEAAAEKGAVSLNLQELVQHPLLWVGMQSRVIIGLGIVFLMTVKPDLAGSLITVGITLVLSVVLALPMLSRGGASMRTAGKTS